jgi:cytosine/uracil/thiamine/allantoin permease
VAALIEWNTVGEIFVESVAAGVVIVAAFAFGARLVAVGTSSRQAGRSAVGSFTVAGLCFLISLAAVAYGIYFTIDK